MIAGLNGEVVDTRGDGLVLLAVGPVTLELMLPCVQAHELRPRDHVELHTYLHFSSSADQLRLFGFTDRISRDLFVTLIGGSGIGPRVALALLELGASALVEAVRSEDTKTLTSVSGVGPKLAKKIVVELSEKVAKEFAHVKAGKPREAVADSGPVADALDAVVSLGFTRQNAEAALSKVREAYDGTDTTMLIRKLLAQLAS